MVIEEWFDKIKAPIDVFFDIEWPEPIGKIIALEYHENSDQLKELYIAKWDSVYLCWRDIKNNVQRYPTYFIPFSIKINVGEK